MKNILTGIGVMLFVGFAGILLVAKVEKNRTIPPAIATTRAPLPDSREQKIAAAMWDVAKVFGRDSGCKDASPDLGRLVAEAAIDEQVDPKLVAAVVSVESKCNPFATSSRGAIGLMQIMPGTWKGSYDFENKINLLNEKDNIRTGTHILAGYIKSYGNQDGIVHYQGTGAGCLTCDDQYASKVIKLADGK